MESSKTRYIKLQSSTDRDSGTLASPTFDLTSSSFLQNCRAAQLLSCGFTQLTPNVREGQTAVILQTKDVQIQVPALPNMRIRLDGSVTITIPSPPSGAYTPEQWASVATSAISQGIRAAGSFDFGVEITVARSFPTRFSWRIAADFPPALQILEFFPADAVAPLLGIQSDRFVLYGEGVQSYPGPLMTFPRQTPVNTIHRFTVTSSNYRISELIDALNASDAPFPSLLDPEWSFVDGRVQVSSALSYPLFRVLSVIEDKGSSLAPILGFHGETVAARFFSMQRADTAPGLVGLVSAYLHCRPIATGGTVTMSSSDSQALEVSIMGQIPVSGTPYGRFVQHDFSKSGESYIVKSEDSHDLSRLQVRIRDDQGDLLQLAHPGITLFLRVFLR